MEIEAPSEAAAKPWEAETTAKPEVIAAAPAKPEATNGAGKHDHDDAADDDDKKDKKRKHEGETSEEKAERKLKKAAKKLKRESKGVKEEK